MNTDATRHAARRHDLRVAAAIATTVVVLAGCGARPASTATGDTTATGSMTSPSAVAFPACMRAHGVPNWPDPTISAKGGRPVFDLSGAGIDPRSADTPQVLAKEAACRHQAGGAVPNLPTT